MTDTRNLDVEIAAADAAIKLHEALLRLENNRDFKKVFTEGFFKEFAQNLVIQRGMPEFANTHEKSLQKLDAIGIVHNHLRQLKAAGNHAAGHLVELNKTAVEISLEEDE